MVSPNFVMFFKEIKLCWGVCARWLLAPSCFCRGQRLTLAIVSVAFHLTCSDRASLNLELSILGTLADWQALGAVCLCVLNNGVVGIHCGCQEQNSDPHSYIASTREPSPE